VKKISTLDHYEPPWLWATALAGSTAGWEIDICALFLRSHMEVYHIPERGLKGFEAESSA